MRPINFARAHRTARARKPDPDRKVDLPGDAEERAAKSARQKSMWGTMGHRGRSVKGEQCHSAYARRDVKITLPTLSFLKDES